MHINGSQEVQPDAYLNALPHTIALARYEGHTEVDLHPHSIKLVHKPDSRTHGRLADTFPHAVDQALGYEEGEQSA